MNWNPDEQAVNVDGYTVPEGKDYLAALQEPGISQEQQGERHYAPIRDFLDLNKSEERNRIAPFMIFVGVIGEQFHYKNDCTGESIVIDRTGRVVSQQADALYWYDPEEEEAGFRAHIIHTQQ